MGSAELEDKIRSIGLIIYNRAMQRRMSFFRADIHTRTINWAMRNEPLKFQLLSMVAALPGLSNPHQIVQYLSDNLTMLPRALRFAIRVAGRTEIGSRIVAGVVRKMTRDTAMRFIAGAKAEESLPILQEMRRQKMAFTMDILGEVATDETRASIYQDAYLDLLLELSHEAESWKHVPVIDSARGRPIPKVNVSLKLTGLCCDIDESSIEAIKSKLRPILLQAKDLRAFVNIDMEYSSIKDLTLRVFKELLMEPAFRDWKDCGIVLQAYLKDSEQDARDLIDWTRLRGTPVTVRLVKGAYWDTEVEKASRLGVDPPVFTDKFDTDANFEKLAGLFIENHPYIRLAIGSHNIRSIACVMANAEDYGLPQDAVEYQMLYGMADTLKRAVVERGYRLRVYTPCGELITGISYLIRRLLENTANESFIRQGFAEGVPADELLRDPKLQQKRR